MITEAPGTTLDSYLNPTQSELLHFDVDENILKEYALADLPNGIGIIGGAARAIAWSQCFGEKDVGVRDVDLVGFEELSPDESTYHELSLQYMPDDYEHGYGVKTDSLEKYFLTRDFTINEVAIVDGTLLMTQAAYEALRDKRIQFSDYEVWEDGSVSGKLYQKGNLLACVLQERFGKGEFDAGHTWPHNDNDFYFALALNKALQYGWNVTRRFLGEVGKGARSDDGLRLYVTELIKELETSTDFTFRLGDSDEQLWRDMPPIDDAKIDHAIELMYQYRGKLPPGADDY